MKNALIAVVLAFVSFTAYAQRTELKATPEQRAEAQTKTMTENLKLSDDQQKQVYALNLDRTNTMQEIKDAQVQNRSKMKESMESFNEGLLKVLTPEQQVKYKAMMKDHRNNRGRNRR